MTYGDIAAQLRDELTWLLERRRIGQQLGGPGSFRMPVTTTEAQRTTLGSEIQRCRDAVLTYCLEAARAATPTVNLDRNQRRRDVVGRLRHQLEETYEGVSFGEPRSSTLEQLPRFELVDRWQHAARLAVQGEREIAGLQRASLSREQQRVVLKDCVDLVRGLVVLDNRYRGIPGWSHLAHRGRLLSAADAAASHLAARNLDLSVDHLGWQPDPGAIEGPALPGIAGVLQAQHNVVVDLTHFPSAYNLRHVLVAQAALSQSAALRAHSVGSPTAATFEQRQGLYRDLVVASRSLGGELGAGRLAALESANAARRIIFAPGTDADVEKTMDRLAHLSHLSHRVDARVATAVEHGFRERLYFIAVKLPAVGQLGPDGIHRAAERWISGDTPAHSDLLSLVRSRLRPSPVPPPASDSQSRHTRDAFEAVVRMERPTDARSGPRP